MYNVTILLSLALSVLLIIIFLMNSYFSLLNNKDREKITPFECGFDPITTSRLPFSMQFFMIALLFLIFDVEIMLILPLIPILKKIFSGYITMTFLFFMIMLIVSLWIEWLYSYLNWIN